MSVQQRVVAPDGRLGGGRFSTPFARGRTQHHRIGIRRTDHGPSARHEDLAFQGTGVRCTAWQTDVGSCLVLAYGTGERPPIPDNTTDAQSVVLPKAVADAIGSALGQTPCCDAGRFLTTVLVTDIVDSTGMAMQLGDRRWREVLADHYAACRSEVERRAGELVKTTGDGVVAIFDGPARAVRAAIAIQAAASAAGIAVRAGLHTGECERLGDDLAGVAVHIAARVCALCGPGEVMTTGTVRDLAIGSMLAFEPRGSHELRGVPDRWPVFRSTDQ